MNAVTTKLAWTVAGGIGGIAVAGASYSAPPRTKANVAPFGAHSGKRYVPLETRLPFEPSGWTSYRSVSPPIRMASWPDHDASPDTGRVVCVTPCVSATTVPSAVL